MVTNGDVIYVHGPKPAAVTAAAPPPEPEPEEAAEAALAPEVAEEALQPPAHPAKAWLYTAAPEGYAVEFGTGRLVRLRSNGLNPVVR